MKIAFVTGCFPKLSETFVLDQITGLIDLGHDVRIFSFEAATDAVQHESVARYGLDERLLLLDAPTGNQLAGALRALPSVGTWLAAVGDGEALRTRFARGSQGSFDVIYCHFGHVAERARRLKRAGFFSGPLVAVFHAYDLAVFPRLRGRDCYARLFAEAERLLPITEHWRHELIALGADAAKIEVRPMGVDLDAFAFRERTLAPGEVLRLVSVGRLVAKKGFDLAIDALASARQHLSMPLVYHVVGDGPLRSELVELTRARGLSEIVTFHGARTHGEVAALLESAHVLLAPSITAADGDKEGLPVVLLEAMARGLPVVSSYHSGIPELVRNGQTGWLIPEGDRTALADTLVDVARHPERWAEIGRSARRAVETRHDIRQLTRDLAAFFESLDPKVSAGDRARQER